MDLVVLIDMPDFTLASKSRLLKRAQAHTVTEAAGLLQRARARDKLMLQLSVSGYEHARERGLREGAAQAQAEWAGRLAAAAAARQVALRDLAPALVDLVADAAGVVLKNADRRQLLAGALDAVGGLLKQARWARLRVHPTQADAARETLGAFDDQACDTGLVSVVADPTLKADDCVFETDAGIADAGLETQLAAIRSALETAVASLVAPADGGPPQADVALEGTP